MKTWGKEPNWDECNLNNKRTSSELQSILEKAQVFPDELKPQEVSSWRGIPFRDWYKKVMNPQ